VGPNADNDLDQLGDWSLGSSQHTEEKGKHPRECTVTVLDGLRTKAAQSGCEVTYAKGCSVMTDETDGIAEAVALAEGADVTVVAIGDQIPLVGEFLSTATLELQGGQLQLLEALSKTGKPLIVVLINSKPLVLPPTVQNAAAIIEAFNPGMQGGQAIAELIFGDLNPSGKLTTSFPYHVGQQPIYYSQVRGQHGKRYADLTQDPLFAFGHGLSYTSYEYSNLRVLTPELRRGDAARIEVEVANTGQRAGHEIVQVYIEDEVTSVTWVQMELKAFERVHLEPGEKKTLSFTLPFEAFSLVNAAGERVVEAGSFKVYAGPSSLRSALLADDISVVD
jgi:beta-glucosidase